MLNRTVGGGALFLECAAGFDVNRDREALMTGHSMGGDIVMYFAKEYPDEVKWVVTLDNLRVPFVKHGKFKILSLRSNEGATARGDDAWRLTHRSGHQRCAGALRSIRRRMLGRLAARGLARLCVS